MKRPAGRSADQLVIARRYGPGSFRVAMHGTPLVPGTARSMKTAPAVTICSPPSVRSGPRPCRRGAARLDRPDLQVFAFGSATQTCAVSLRRRRASRGTAGRRTSAPVMMRNAREHLGLQLARRVIDLGANRQTMRLRHRSTRRHRSGCALNDPPGNAGTATSTGSPLCRQGASSSRALATNQTFDRSPIMIDRALRPGRGADDVLPQPDLPLHDGAADRRANHVSASSQQDVGRRFDRVDVGVGFAQNAQPVAHRGKRDRRGVHPALRRGEVDLRLLPVFQRGALSQIQRRAAASRSSAPD